MCKDINITSKCFSTLIFIGLFAGLTCGIHSSINKGAPPATTTPTTAIHVNTVQFDMTSSLSYCQLTPNQVCCNIYRICSFLRTNVMIWLLFWYATGEILDTAHTVLLSLL